jgi:hypothetical protein
VSGVFTERDFEVQCQQAAQHFMASGETVDKAHLTTLVDV